MSTGQKNENPDNRKCTLMGSLAGLLSFLAVSWFKDNWSVSALLPGALCVIACGWGCINSVPFPDRRRRMCCLIPSLFFSACCLVGFSFAMDSTPERLYGSRILVIKTCTAFLGYTVVFFLGLSGIFQLLKARESFSYKTEEKEPTGYVLLLNRFPFWTAFLTMLLAYLPYMLASYPALFMGDCQTILPQGFGIAPLSTHHPVPYTLFVTGVIRAGQMIFHSWNAGAFLFSLVQILCFLTIMAFSVRVLIRYANLSWKWAVILEAWFVFGPRISNCMFVMTKDVYYAAFLLLLAVTLFLILHFGWSGRRTLLLVLATLGVLIFRKDGFYVLVISYFAFFLFSCPLRKRIPVFLIGVLALHLLFNQVIYPAAGIEKGSVKEMLSIPLQQTARCAKYLGDSLSEEEKTEILDLFTFESIKEMGDTYDPSLVDYIKFRFPEKVDSTILQRYLRLWVSMGMKYPATYVNAFINNYFEYFYPGCIFMQCSYDWSETCFQRVNDKIGSDFSYPGKLTGFRHGLETVREKVFETQPFRLLNMPGMTTWFLLAWVFYLFWRKDFNSLMLAVPILVVMLICIASPCNGYYCRYQYPLLTYLPWAMLSRRARKEKQ